MSDEPLLSVRGEAVLEVDPEVATVGVTIVAQDADRAKALRLLDERGRANDAVLDGFRDAIARTETAGVRVSPQFRSGKPRERIVGYVAVLRTTLSVSDFSRLGELIARLADQDLTEVGGPWWSLRPDTTAHRDARSAAIRDALQRARDYAAAVGSELVALVELADSQLLSDGARQEAVYMSARAAGPARGGGAPEELTFDIVPAKQVVRASVEARFRISPPDLGAIRTT